ncbi:MAG: hypothetical protein K5744_09060 [Eubacterium sp.]|nr:hypothetical protein [Eubacterium sp.]
MSRGYMFGLTTKRRLANIAFCEADVLVSHMDEIGSFYIENEKFTGDVKSPERRLARDLSVYGFETGVEDDLKDAFGNAARWIRFSNKARENYFEAKFERLRMMVSEMSLKEFSSRSVYQLQECISDEYADMIWIDGEPFCSKDEAIRKMTPGEKYYITSAVYLH